MRDLMGLMKQAQAMQEKMQAAQAELDRVEVEGASGGGANLSPITNPPLARTIISTAKHAVAVSGP